MNFAVSLPAIAAVEVSEPEVIELETDIQTDIDTNLDTEVESTDNDALPLLTQPELGEDAASENLGSAVPESTDSQSTIAQSTVIQSTVAQATESGGSNSSSTATTPTVQQLAAPSVAQSDMGQVTSVSQLSDVQPTDWAFQALQSLVERYGCIAGYPDGTYRGNRALTRYEFAAGLNACLDRVNELIAEGLSQAVTREDLATLQRLQEEFAVELATLRGRVDALEARTAELEANQFSTTTRLNGETIFGVVSVIDGDNANGESISRNPTFGYRVRLNLETSFTGEDLLTTRLQASNVEPLGGTNSGVLGTNEGRIEFDGDSNNEVSLALLRYRFPISDRTNVYIAATGNGFVDLDASSQLTPYLDGVAVSLFGLRNPIYNYSFGAGLGIRHFFNDNLELNLGYLTPDAGDPSPGQGLFNGRYGALAQLIVYPTEDIRIGFTYINSFTPSNDDFGLATGSNLANSDFGRAVVTNSYGISTTVDITPGLAIGGWVGYSQHRYIGLGDGEVWTWAASLSFPDLFGEGNTGGILVGMEPRLTELDANINGGATDPDVSLHVEAFYRYRLSDNIDITPGIIWLTAPNHEQDNDDAVIGVLRTRFFF
ncbi:iron uptake porin [Oscillatoria sp. FACHB-1407]|uniref:iron uptake porin n=1 Tax=Oscillatoria sp. FACHB-1407 TaxID=2692847 RepID=UPI001F554845|nr:iron uptake porin [Oscillatoria sp. FACHB-1407]